MPLERGSVVASGCKWVPLLSGNVVESGCVSKRKCCCKRLQVDPLLKGSIAASVQVGPVAKRKCC